MNNSDAEKPLNICQQDFRPKNGPPKTLPKPDLIIKSYVVSKSCESKNPIVIVKSSERSSQLDKC